MNRRTLPVLALAATVLVSVPALQGCYGSFALTKKLYKWNGSLGNKWVKSIVMVAMGVVPVYSIAVGADAVILNLIEFWTGSNPVALQPGERVIRTVTIEGREYRMIATRNRMEMAPLDAPDQSVELSFEPRSGSWIVATPEGTRLVARETGESLMLYHADGHVETLTN